MLKKYVEYLSVKVGPRPSASPAEAEAADYIRGRLDEFGYATEIQEFGALKTFSWLHVLHFGMVLAGWALMNVLPVVTVVLAVAGLAGYAAESSGIELISRIFPKSKSRNVIASLPPSKPARAKVIISAHMDSSRSAMFFHPRLVGTFRQTFVITVTAMITTIVVAALYSLGYGSTWMWAVSGVLNLQILVALLMLIDREIRGKHTPGAVDNASGVAAMLGAAEMMAGEPPEFLELEFVATGSEETGLFGMIHHVEKNWHDINNTYVINIDHVGIGRLVLTGREGMFIRKACDERLLGAAESFRLPSTGEPVSRHDFKTMLTDGYAAQMRGFRTVSIMAFQEDGTLANWHWHSDVAEPVAEANLQDAASLAVHIIKTIDGGLS
ncbi:MAG TPA: M28 family peptidase [bacterium]|nr:M28 family peptidase [bacterium]